jgi:hypothetical protein
MTRLPTVTLQQFLARQGKQPGPAPGRMDRATQTALKDWINEHRNDGPPDLEQVLDRFEQLEPAAKWPGYGHGVMVGSKSYDLSTVDESTFEQDWKEGMSEADRNNLKAAVGQKGHAAAELAFRYQGIAVNPETDARLFRERTLPRLEAGARDVFPNLDNLPPRTRIALLSLYYHRGGDTEGHSRSEIRQIQDMTDEPDLPGIALALLSISRLWHGTPVQRDMETAQTIRVDLVISDFLLTVYNPEQHGFEDAL